MAGAATAQWRMRLHSNTTVDLWLCLQTDRRRRGWKQRAAASGHECSKFYHTFRNVISHSHLVYSMLHHIFKYTSVRSCYIACHIKRLHHTLQLLHSSVISQLLFLCNMLHSSAIPHLCDHPAVPCNICDVTSNGITPQDFRFYVTCYITALYHTLG